MSVKYFTFFYKLHKYFTAREEQIKPYRNRAFIAIADGFAKAGMYLFS